MKQIKKADGLLDDAGLKRRIADLKEFFTKEGTKNYIQFDDYYIELRQESDSDGIRWFHRNKYKVEVVFDALEGGPARNEAGFILFSSMDDALLHAVLTEESIINQRARDKRISV